VLVCFNLTWCTDVKLFDNDDDDDDGGGGGDDDDDDYYYYDFVLCYIF